MHNSRTLPHLLSGPHAARSTRSAPRPSLLTAAGRYDAGAVMRLAHDLARDDVADAAAAAGSAATRSPSATP